jgi:hypothetical protein
MSRFNNFPNRVSSAYKRVRVRVRVGVKVRVRVGLKVRVRVSYLKFN